MAVVWLVWLVGWLVCWLVVWVWYVPLLLV